MAILNTFTQPMGTKASLYSLASSNGLTVGQVYFLTDEQRLVVAVTTNTFQAMFGGMLNVFCSGKPATSEVIGGAIFPVAGAIVAGSCVAKATVAATASTIFTIAKDGTAVGTITFAAGATLGTVSITAGNLTANQNVTITAPSSPDATLANISFLVRA